jgi:hypothetical protein
MGLKSKLAFVVAIPLALVFVTASAEAQDYYDGQLHIGGFIRWDGSAHYGPLNPANARVQTENNSWNRFRVWAQINFDINPTNAEWFSLFAKINYDGDFTQDVDSTLFPARPGYDSFPNFPHDMSAQNDTNRLRLWEIYADFRPGNFWLRIGRQTIAWGDTIAFRTTDILNPLDLSWNFFGWPWFEEFQYIREPQWMARINYDIPSESMPDLEIEGIVNFNFIPTNIADVGSPVALAPAFLSVTSDNPEDLEAGLRFRGTFGRWALSFLYYNGFADGGKGEVQSAFPFTPDMDRGIDFGFGCCFVLDLVGVHPRENNVGMTGNRYFQNIDGIFNFEWRLTPDQAYAGAGGAPFETASTLTYSVALDKNVSIKALNYGRSFNMGLQFQHIVLLDDDKLGQIEIDGSPVTKHSMLINYTVRTGFKNDNIQPFFLLLWDPEGAAWFSPYIQFIYGDHWRFWAGFNHVVANDDTRNDAAKGFPVGFLDWVDEFVWRVGFQF